MSNSSIEEKILSDVQVSVSQFILRQIP